MGRYEDGEMNIKYDPEHTFHFRGLLQRFFDIICDKSDQTIRFTLVMFINVYVNNRFEDEDSDLQTMISIADEDPESLFYIEFKIDEDAEEVWQKSRTCLPFKQAEKEECWQSLKIWVNINILLTNSAQNHFLNY